MGTEEIYIRAESETEARGPFNLEQLISLADTGQVTAETLYYDAHTEQWAALGSNAELLGQILPQRKKLKIKARPSLTVLNEESDSTPPITVEEMLAAAEGRTAETAGKKDPTIAMARAAAIGRYALILILLVCAAGELLPAAEAIMTMDPIQILSYPLALLGAVDLTLATLLWLGAVTLYPFVRFRAALGIGFVGFIFWTQGQVVPLVYLVGGSIGLYTATIFFTYTPVLVAAGVGLAGLGSVAWHLLSTT